MNLRLKEFRKRKGMRQEDLAESLSTTARVIGSWERQETALPLEDASAIADVLECTLDELAGRDWPPPGVSGLPADEGELLGNYRASDPPRQDTLRQLARDMAGMSRDEAEAEADKRRKAA